MRCFDVLRILLLTAALVLPAWAEPRGTNPEKPHILLITIDTLRADHLSGYGYGRATSPHLDQLMDDGVRFSQARTVMPLTCPALASMFTAMPPHVHGSTRNGLPIRQRLPSLPKVLARHGYERAAFVSNSVLRGHLCGLDEHFDVWEDILNRRRLFVTWRESHADDITDRGLEFVEDHLDSSRAPFFLWLHYVEPHFPYVLQKDYLEQIGVSRGKSTLSPRNRYDSEIARVDASIGRLLETLEDTIDRQRLLVIFTSDHGESLGHHGYWGHGKYVYDAGLHVPLSITWPGRLTQKVIDAPAVLVDLPATVLGLLDIPRPEVLDGFDFVPVMDGFVPEPMDRMTFYQTHKSSIIGSEKQRSAEVRPKGLREVGVLHHGRKEIFQVRQGERRVYDHSRDRGENRSLVAASSEPSESLREWLRQVQEGLDALKHLGVPTLDEKTVEELEALGYAN